MTICTRPSCGADLDPTSSTFQTSPCIHHPGAPIFHEGQKSWSCCKEVNKPVLDFDDFVKIAGCTTVEGHSTERPKQAATTKPSSSSGEEVKGVKGPDGKEVFGGGGGAPAATTPTAAPTPTPTPSQPQPYVEPCDPASITTLTKGATCKRPGCGFVVSESGDRPSDRSQESCSYHKGFPIFHEGSKGYSCCKRRVLEFSEFLKIEPCTSASTGHLFTQPPKSKAKATTTNGNATSAGTETEEDLLQSRGLTLQPDEEETECRMDHYETPDEVRMTIYCKGVKMDQSKVLLEDDDIFLSLALPPTPASNNKPRRHLLHLPLYGPIEPHPTSTFTVSTSKIKMDLTLVKKHKGSSWPTLQRGGTGGGYGLTFGRS